jgi:hypothetical protein
MNVNEISAMANRMSPTQLQQAMRDETIPPYIGYPILQQKVKLQQAAKNAQSAGQPQPPTVAEQVEGAAHQANMEDVMRQRAMAMQADMGQTGGISDFLPKQMAKGGVIAFNARGLVPGMTLQQAYDIMDEPMATPEEKAQAQQLIAQQQTAASAPQIQTQPAVAPQPQPQGLGALYDEAIAQNPIVTAEQARQKREEFLGPNTGIASLREDINKMKTEATEDKERAPWMALMKAGLATMAGTSPYALTNIGKGAQEGVADYIEAQKDYRKAAEKQLELNAKLGVAERQEKIDAYNYGDNAEITSKSANTRLKVEKAKTENEAELNKARLDLEKERNDISRTTAADTAAFHKSQLENNVYAQGRKLAEMQNDADKLRAAGDEQGALAIERKRANLDESFNMANPSIYGQSPDIKVWGKELDAIRSRANSIETQLGTAQKINAFTADEKAAKSKLIDDLQKEKKVWDDKLQHHMANKPSSTSPTTGLPQITTGTPAPKPAVQSIEQRPKTNSKGWNLMQSNGQYAYVNPNNPTEYEVVQ